MGIYQKETLSTPQELAPNANSYALLSDYQRQLKEWLQEQSDTLKRYEFNGQQVWVKRAAPVRSRFNYILLGAVVKILRTPWLSPVAQTVGGEASLAVEVRRLRQLHAAGICVPQVLAAQPDGFMMQSVSDANMPYSDLAHAFDSLAKQKKQSQLLAYWQDGLNAIAQVHDKAQCLSQAFARNMVLGERGKIFFIDFEDDPQAALPLVQCQLRDVLCYVHSSAMPLQEADVLQQAQNILKVWLQRRPQELQEIVKKAAKQLSWLSKLPKGKRWGRDTQRVRAGAVLLASCLMV